MRTLFSLGLAVLLAGCDPGSTLPESPDHVGTFVLRTVTTDDEGTYAVSDRKLLVTWGRGATESYALADSTVTVFDGDLTLMFHR